MEGYKKDKSKSKNVMMPVIEPPIRKIRSLSDIVSERRHTLGQNPSQQCDVKSVGIFKILENSHIDSNLSAVENIVDPTE